MKNEVSDLIVLDKMAGDNMDVCACTDLLSLDKDKKGGKVTVGVGSPVFENLIQSVGMADGKYTAILFVVNMEQFEEVKKQLEQSQP